MNVALSQQDFLNNSVIQGLLQDKNPSRHKFMDQLIRLFWKYRVICPSQTCLALSNDRCRATANRQLDIMEQMGWITIKRRYNKTCLYTINPIILQARHLLWDKFTALKSLSLYLLGSAVNAAFGKNVTSRINNGVIYKPSLTVRLSTSRETNGNSKGLQSLVRVRRESMEDFVASPVMKVATDVLGLSKWGQIRLSVFTDQALAEALMEYKGTDKGSIKDIFGWFFSRVRTISEKKSLPIDWKKGESFKERYGMPEDAKLILKEHIYSPQTGRTDGFKKVGSIVSVRPPEYVPDRRLNLTKAERISMLSSEISNVEEIIANPQNHFIKKVNLTDTLPNYENLLRHLKEELQELVSPKVEEVHEIDENDMTPEQWLIWNRNRKIQRLKEQNASR